MLACPPKKLSTCDYLLSRCSKQSRSSTCDRLVGLLARCTELVSENRRKWRMHIGHLQCIRRVIEGLEPIFTHTAAPSGGVRKDRSLQKLGSQCRCRPKASGQWYRDFAWAAEGKRAGATICPCISVHNRVCILLKAPALCILCKNAT
ncbi:hypothetical protein D3C85_1277980 [compost metagenome]